MEGQGVDEVYAEDGEGQPHRLCDAQRRAPKRGPPAGRDRTQCPSADEGCNAVALHLGRGGWGHAGREAARPRRCAGVQRGAVENARSPVMTRAHPAAPQTALLMERSWVGSSSPATDTPMSAPSAPAAAAA